jgi:hypothetical protein
MGRPEDLRRIWRAAAGCARIWPDLAADLARSGGLNWRSGGQKFAKTPIKQHSSGQAGGSRTRRARSGGLPGRSPEAGALGIWRPDLAGRPGCCCGLLAGRWRPAAAMGRRCPGAAAGRPGGGALAARSAQAPKGRAGRAAGEKKSPGAAAGA